MLRRICLILSCLLLCGAALAEELAWVDRPTVLRPGKTIRMKYIAEAETTVRLLADGETHVLHTAGKTGENAFYWDGTLNGELLNEGEYILCLGELDEVLVVGAPAPKILHVDAPHEASESWAAQVEVNMPGTLTVTMTAAGEKQEVASVAVEAGTHEIPLGDVLLAAPEGEAEVTFRLTDAEGFDSNAVSVNVAVTHPAPARDTVWHTPNEQSPMTCDHEVCYWKLRMGEVDESAVWEVLIQPVTVISGEERHQVKLRAQPDEACTDYTGEVTCKSQAVHVLERGEEWSLVEAYSSSVEGSPVAVFAEHCAGYVKTELLMEKEVDQHYGIVIDKLQQRLYLYKDGRLYSTLLCSTGYARRDTPYHETPAGEFLIVSWTGGFWSGNLYCDMGLRINDGILLHEVPCQIVVEEDSSERRDYSRCETYLGEKASHGCIRIQRHNTPEGINMNWLWNNLSRNPNTKVLIWEDAGRTLGYPDPEVVLYYNPNGGRQYHSDARCRMVRDEYLPLTPFLYGELEDEGFAHLTRCAGCAPQLRTGEIDELNADNAKRK